MFQNVHELFQRFRRFNVVWLCVRYCCVGWLAVLGAQRAHIWTSSSHYWIQPAFVFEQRVWAKWWVFFWTNNVFTISARECWVWTFASACTQVHCATIRAKCSLAITQTFITVVFASRTLFAIFIRLVSWEVCLPLNWINII